MKILVVGGAGYIGGAIVSELISRKMDFTVYDNLTYEHQYRRAVNFINGDVREHDRLGSIIDEHSHIIWLAAIVGDAAVNINKEMSYHVNVISLMRIIKRLLQPVKKIIYASSCSVYGYGERMMEEASELDPLSRYAEHKVAAENLLDGLDSVILRYGTAYGLSEEHSRMRSDLAINRMSLMAAKEGRLDIHGGEQWRPWASIKDIAYASVEGLMATPAGIYNIVTDNLTLADAAGQVNMGAGPVEINYRLGTDPRNYRAHNGKARAAGLILPAALEPIPAAAKEISTAAREGRIRDYKAPIHNNEKWGWLQASLSAGSK